MYVLKNVLNNVDNWYSELGCTREGSCLMLCDVFIGWGATWQCICVVYCLEYRLVLSVS